MGLLDKIKGIAANGAANLIEKAGQAVDGLITSKEEAQALKNELAKITYDHEVKMAEATNKTLELELADMASARKREVDIVTSDKAPLLNKIIQPLLAILILGSCFLMWYIIMFKDIPDSKRELVAGIVGSLTTLSMGVVSYFFGSSTGSAAKQKQIEKMME